MTERLTHIVDGSILYARENGLFKETQVGHGVVIRKPKGISNNSAWQEIEINEAGWKQSAVWLHYDFSNTMWIIAGEE